MNSSQKEAVEKTTGPCIILAGAGTGKTHTIVEKIKHILNTQQYAPERIVCLTFSNEAANEMRKRVLAHLKEEQQEPIIRTFHSFCVDLLKKHGTKLDIPEEFKILLPDDAKILIHKQLRVQPYLCHQYIGAIGIAKDLGITQEALQTYLSKKTQQQTVEELTKQLEDIQFQLQMAYASKSTDKKQIAFLKEKVQKIDSVVKTKRFAQVWNAYEKLKQAKKMLDYADLNQQALILLEKHPEISSEYDYIIVDEFQDTNKMQCDLLALLALHKNITVVGDLNQSIYRFRGAYKHNLDMFKKTFGTKATDIIALDKSFRSTNTILTVAHQLILNNYKNKEECFPVYNAHDHKGESILAFELKNNKEEIRKIIELVKQELANGTPHEEICVLFRTHQQARALKTALEYANIPFTSVTKKSLLKLTPIKLTHDYLTIAHKLKQKEKGGEQAWWDLIYHSQFSKEDAVKISSFIKEHKTADCLSVKALNDLPTLPLSEIGRSKLKMVIKQIKTVIPHTELPLPELIRKVYEIAGLANKSRNKELLLMLERFHEFAEEYSSMYHPSLGDFLHHLEVVNNLGIQIESPNPDQTGVRIMTHHATKGLEYHTVIVSNLAQKRFPIETFSKSIIPSELSPELAPIIQGLSEGEKESVIKQYEQQNQLLEERRLCYVACTRAKKKLIFTYAAKYGERKTTPSQFLTEIQYKTNPVIDFFKDDTEKYQEPKPELRPAASIHVVLAAENPEHILEENKPVTSEDLVFSPSSLQLFTECKKRYEYKYIYNMPEPIPVSWEAMKLGSFVHLIAEKGVNLQYKTEKEFIDLAKTMHVEDQWNFIDLDQAIPLIRVFFHRNKNKYNQKSITEKKLYTSLEQFKFMGVADRIDIHENNELEIIDYKTGAGAIKPAYRNWQLGFYAIAAQSLGTPKRLTLDLLKKEKPLEFDVDSEGNAVEIHSQRISFNIQQVRQELVQKAQEIIDCHQNGFSPCPPEKNCDFCNEYVWNL